MCCSILCLHSQNTCKETNLDKAQQLLSHQNPYADQYRIFKLIEPCALNGHAEAENYLGLFYLNGIGIKKDKAKAFRYISSSANKGFHKAQFNLGRLYKYGIGCNIDFKKSVSWFEKATKNGNQKAAYSLGYMYYKGYGVNQDYNKAVHWFSNSSNAMAQHFLGVCYYFGYGVKSNQLKAIEYLSGNGTVNSKTFLNYVKKNIKTKLETDVQETLTTKSVQDSTYIAQDVITDNDYIENKKEPLKKEAILGEWVGKIVQYDWSGKNIVRLLPIEIAFTSKNKKIEVKTIIAKNKPNYAFAHWQNANIFIEDRLDFNLEKIYSSNPREFTLNYSLFGITSLQEKNLLGKNYLTGAMDTFIDSWVEFGQPMSMVLTKKDKNSNTNLENSAIIKALSAQENHFIKLYPVPFVNKLTVQYQLKEPSDVYIELSNLTGEKKATILPKKRQATGDYLYTVPIDESLPNGIYIVRIQTNNKMYTRIILKDK